MSVDVGDEAPDFELPDSTRTSVRLSSFRGRKNVVLVFYPLALTPICQSELCAVRDSIADFSNDDVVTLAISCDNGPTHALWAEREGYSFPLLSDFWPHGAVARAYGVFDEASGLALRGTFVVDRDGRVVHKVVNGIPEARDVDAWKTVLAGL